MAYDVEIPPAVVDYIATVAIPAVDQDAVLLGVIAELSQDADKFLEKHPLGHESLHFKYDYIHPTYETLFTFNFIVDPSHREMGVVRVVFVECVTEPMQ